MVCMRQSSGNSATEYEYLQETRLIAYSAYTKRKHDSDDRPWINANAEKLSRNRARDGARRARVIVPEDKENPAANRSGEVHRGFTENDGYAAVHLRELMSALPARQREALHLRYFAGLDYAGIATAMDCSQQSARANVSQAMKKLRSMW